jgi:hypothetical protein
MNSFIVCDRNKNAWKTSDKLKAMLKAEGWTHVVGLPEDTVLMCVCAHTNSVWMNVPAFCNILNPLSKICPQSGRAPATKEDAMLAMLS